MSLKLNELYYLRLRCHRSLWAKEKKKKATTCHICGHLLFAVVSFLKDAASEAAKSLFCTEDSSWRLEESTLSSSAPFSTERLRFKTQRECFHQELCFHPPPPPTPPTPSSSQTRPFKSLLFKVQTWLWSWDWFGLFSLQFAFIRHHIACVSCTLGTRRAGWNHVDSCVARWGNFRTTTIPFARVISKLQRGANDSLMAERFELMFWKKKQLFAHLRIESTAVSKNEKKNPTRRLTGSCQVSVVLIKVRGNTCPQPRQLPENRTL